MFYKEGAAREPVLGDPVIRGQLAAHFGQLSHLRVKEYFILAAHISQSGSRRSGLNVVATMASLCYFVLDLFRV